MRRSPIAGMGYIVVQTTEVESWRSYAASLLGMMPSKLPLPEGMYAFRMDDRMARVIVQPGDHDVAAVGWEVASRDDWDELLQRLEKAGVKGETITGAEAQQRGVTTVHRVNDPSGGVVEFAAPPDARCDRPLRVADGRTFRDRRSRYGPRNQSRSKLRGHS